MTVIVGPNPDSVSKTVTVPGVLRCPSPCGKGCRTNRDYPEAPDEFYTVVDAYSGRITVTRKDAAAGWGMDLKLTCCASGMVRAFFFMLQSFPRK